MEIVMELFMETPMPSFAGTPVRNFTKKGNLRSFWRKNETIRTI